MFFKEWFNSVLYVSLIGTVANFLCDSNMSQGIKKAVNFAVSLAVLCSCIMPVLKNIKNIDADNFVYSFPEEDYTENYLASLENALKDALVKKVFENTGINIRDISIELDVKKDDFSKEVVVKKAVIILSAEDFERKEEIEKMIDFDAEIKRDE